MIPQTCLLIETTKFPVLEGEDDEIVNERMYGKALCQYLEANLPSVGVSVPSFNNEDWGWWVDVQYRGFGMGLCVYSDPGAEHPERYALLPSIAKAKRWSWSKFRSVDVSKDVLDVMSAVEQLFRKDGDIRSVTRHDDFPL